MINNNTKVHNWTKEDHENNQALKQNFYSINYFNFRHGTISDLETKIKPLLENKILELANLKAQASRIKDPQQKQDIKQKYTEYGIFIQNIIDKVTAASIYLNNETVSLAVPSQLIKNKNTRVKPKRKYTKRVVKKE